MKINHELVKFRKGGRQLGIFFNQEFGSSTLIIAGWLGALYLDFIRK